MFRFCAAPAGIAPRHMIQINSGAIEAPLNFRSAAEERGKEAQLQLADELREIGVTEPMAANIEELYRRSGQSHRTLQKVLSPVVRSRVGEEKYKSLAEGWTGVEGKKLAATYFKLHRAAGVAGAAKAVSAAQQTPKTSKLAAQPTCKKCGNPSAPGNYGFCREHRSSNPPLKKQKVKSETWSESGSESE